MSWDSDQTIHRAIGVNPPSRGDDVEKFQNAALDLLKGWKLDHPDAAKFSDGDFGDRTKKQGNRVLRLLGADPAGAGAAGPSFTQDEQRYVRDPSSRSDTQKERSKRRVAEAQAKQQTTGGAAALRLKIVENAKWGVAHEPSIHYAQIRPIPHHLVVPMTTDCSGFVTVCYEVAGGPDPNGFGFNGAGFTGTILAACHHIAPSECKPADLIVYGPGSGHHVVMAIEAGANPMTVSHGQEGGPLEIRHSTEDAYQPEPETFCRILDD